MLVAVGGAGGRGENILGFQGSGGMGGGIWVMGGDSGQGFAVGGEVGSEFIGRSGGGGKASLLAVPVHPFPQVAGKVPDNAAVGKVVGPSLLWVGAIFFIAGLVVMVVGVFDREGLAGTLTATIALAIAMSPDNGLLSLLFA